ncbi:SRPBCC domain-containing protein [Alcanivoracaceae bacterium MT1]
MLKLKMIIMSLGMGKEILTREKIMVKLRHAIKIAASTDRVYQALTDPEQMVSWHAGEVTGVVALGDLLELQPKPGLRFGWKTVALNPGVSLVQTCVEGPGGSIGRTLRFDLSGADAHTTVTLTDGDWSENDPHLPFCNTHWGQVLHDLKIFLEEN